jgi:SAM-dependent methyltransferase
MRRPTFVVVDDELAGGKRARRACRRGEDARHAGAHLWEGFAVPSPLRPSVALRYDVVRRTIDRYEARPARILEIGCGLGGISLKLAEHGQYVGLEPDETSFAVAHERLEGCPGAEVRNERFEDLPAGEVFDLVCAFEVLEHLADDRAVLGAWASRVAPGGLLMVTVPGYQKHFSAYDEYVGHYRRYEPEGLEQLFVSVGLSEVSVTNYGFPLNHLVELVHTQIARRRRSHGTDPGDTMEEKTAASGRVLSVPDPMVSALTFAATPFRISQRMFPHRGLGLLAVGRAR